eukprot:COSAG04_NODE_15195_length_540_cov_0.748299_1_plen_87_part_00
MFFAGWLSSRTHPQQRVVVLGMGTNSVLAVMVAVMISWHSSGLWDGGEFVFVALLISLFWFQCVVGPTAMAIASMIAAEKAKNANG